MNTAEKTRPPKKVIFRLVACSAILLLGAAGMFVLASMKKAPAKVQATERPLRVMGERVHPIDHPVQISGYGQVQALNSVAIASEVAGRVVQIHPMLESGYVVPADAVLFKIDPKDYQAALQEAKARVAQWQSTIRRLETQLALDRKRLKTLTRSRELAQTEYERLRQLFEQDKVGTRSGVDAAERGYNAAADQADQMAQAVALYPLQIQEAQSQLASAQATLLRAKTNLERCVVTTQFQGRVTQAQVEVGQYVSPGQHLVTLADDRILEIRVPLDSRDARRWLKFSASAANEANTANWFNGLENVVCRIHWTEDPAAHGWTGKLNRVVNFDPQTRTLTVAIRVTETTSQERKTTSLPLVEGMFCEVTIPGRTLKNVYRLPRWAVSFENTVYLSVDDRLRTVPVTVAHIEGEYTYIKEGLAPGNIVVVTRLINPLENALLDVHFDNNEEKASS
jgi:multidrug efflux pump subunit AcrA (membrane-fusion protein)